jgi:flagellin-like hook-associated protein FlgL
VAAISAKSGTTGVTASATADGRLTLTSTAGGSDIVVDDANLTGGGIGWSTSDKSASSLTSPSMFAALKDLKDALEANDVTAIQQSLTRIESAVNLAADDLSSVGTYTSKIESLSTTLTSTDTNLTVAMSSIMDVDTVEAYSNYMILSTSYEAALSVLTKMEKMSILNYI